MRRIDTSTRSVDLFGTGKDGFKDGNVGLGIAATAFNAAWCNSVQEEISNVIETFGVALNEAANNQLLEALNSAFSSYMIIRDEKPSGTPAQNSVVGYTKRVLNTVVYNSIVGASLASNHFTLPAGKYLIDASAPANTNAHFIALKNENDGIILATGTTENSCDAAVKVAIAGLDPIWTRSFITTIIDLPATKSLSIQHYTDYAYPSGLGYAADPVVGVPQVYAVVSIKKIG